jgi:UDP-2,4-diacetamido-2,4,6-trideoxy-beta-L-altropyranose hydrolase
MKVLFRVDSGKYHSAGHLLRSLNLAREFSKNGAEVFFLTKNYPNNFNSFIDSQFEVILIDQNLNEDEFNDEDYSTWNDETDDQEYLRISSLIMEKSITHLVVDHYGISHSFDKKITDGTDVIYISIDDLDRNHICDVLVNQNFGIKKDFYGDSTYKKLLLGPTYSLIDASFSEARLKIKPRKKISEILVFFGGSDKSNEVSKVLKAVLRNPGKKYSYTFIVPKYHTEYNQVVLAAENNKFIKLVEPVNNFSLFLSNFDLMFCASGATNWERCCLGIPCFSVVTADNQEIIAENLSNGGYSINLGSGFNTSSSDWEKVIHSLGDRELELLEMSKKCYNLTDGSGCKNILAEIIDL